MLEAAGAVVLRDDPDGATRVLVVHRPRYDDWSLPKGHPEPGEPAEAAALREVAEETGVVVRVLAPLGSTTHPTPAGDKRVTWFRAEARAGDPAARTADDEVDEACWVTLADAADRLTHASDRAVLLRAVADHARATSAPAAVMSAPLTPAPATPAPVARPLPVLGAAPARYAQEVTAAAVGERVSVRRLIDDPERGPVPSDVVGRLVGADDEALLIVDRAGHLSVIPTAAVVASRLVPPHPRLPPEPLPGTADRPLPREAARTLVLDAADRTLLVAHLPGDGTTVWTAPGGGLDAGEDHRGAARRELVEELGIDVEPGPWVWSRTARFAFRGVWIEQRERWYLVRLDAALAGAIDLDDLPLADVGTAGARWFTVEELAEGSLRLAPRRLAVHLGRLVRSGPPGEPLDVGA